MRRLFVAHNPEGWIEDTCAGGALTRDLRRARCWQTADDAYAELRAADIDITQFSVLPVFVEVKS